MEMTLAREANYIDVIYFTRECIKYYNKEGLFHWNNSYPDSDDLLNSILKQNIYILKDLQRIVGMFKILDEAKPEFSDIKWNESDKPLMFEYFSVHPDWFNKDAGKEMLLHLNNKALEEDFTSIRTDVFDGNQFVINLLKSDGFEELGTTVTKPQNLIYRGFEKLF